MSDDGVGAMMTGFGMQSDRKLSDGDGGEVMIEGVSREAVEGGVVVYSLKTTLWGPIKTWLEGVVASLENWPVEEPCRLLYDFTEISLFSVRGGSVSGCDFNTLGLSPENNERIDKILEAKPKLQIRLAIIVNPTMSAKVTKLLGIHPSKYRLKHFTTREKGVEWLCREDVGTLPPSRPVG